MSAVNRAGESRLEWPHGTYGLWADDDDVIGLKVAATYPHGFHVVRTDPPLMDSFDEYEVGQFLAWCLSNRALVEEWEAGRV